MAHLRFGSSIQEVPTTAWLDTPIAVRDAIDRRTTCWGVVADAAFIPDSEHYVAVVPGMGIRAAASSYDRVVVVVRREARRILGYEEGRPLPVYLRFSAESADYDRVYQYFYSEEGE